MLQCVRPASFLCVAIVFGIFAISIAAQAPFVKTTYGVTPVELPLWARLSEVLSDADIAKINLKAFAKGNKKAAWELGLAYMQGLGVPEDFAKAEQMFEIGAVDSDEKAMVGMFYAHGYFPKNLDAVDLAQHFYVEALNEAKARDFSGYDAIAWTRLSSQKMYADFGLLKAMTAGLNKNQVAGANAAYEALVETRARYGAYYAQDDPLRDSTPTALAAMDQDDPDVRLRQAFNSEKAAASDEQIYERVLATYRDVRDHADTDPRFVLGRYALNGTNGVPKNLGAAEYWLGEAVRSGSKPAQELLDQIKKQSAAK